MRTALWMILLAGCGSAPATVAPASVEDNFFLSWELRGRATDCAAAGAATVDLDLVNADTGERFRFSLLCARYEGSTGPVSVGRFDVLVNLSDDLGRVLGQRDLGDQNRTNGGTIDLGHVVLPVP